MFYRLFIFLIISIITLLSLSTLSYATTDTDGDGVTDDIDACILVKGTGSERGCPKVRVGQYGKTMNFLLSGQGIDTSKDDDGDTIGNGVDLCPTISGTDVYDGCPSPSLLSEIKGNACLYRQFQNRGIIFGSPVCVMCPCDTSIRFEQTLRTCDVVFPAVLSQDKNTIYSRGGLFLIE